MNIWNSTLPFLGGGAGFFAGDDFMDALFLEDVLGRPTNLESPLDSLDSALASALYYY
jgi:hypothetical protein